MSKIAVVTGGSSGIGKSIVEKFLSNGYKVYSFGNTKSNVEDTIAKLSNYKQMLNLLVGDIKNPEFIDSFFNHIEEKEDHIDILINNAGIVRINNFENETIEEWDEVVQTNLSAVYKISKRALPLLKKSKVANILNISSDCTKAVPKENTFSSYTVSKVGINSLTEIMAANLAKYHIRVNAISPGPVYTNIYRKTKSWNNEAEYKAIKDKICPIGRAGKAEDIAETVFFITSDKSLITTGANILVDSGCVYS